MPAKQGIELIVDRVEALRVRIGELKARHAEPPTNVGDERLIAQLWHWEQLCEEALAESIRMRQGYDRISAMLALARSAPIGDITGAVEALVRRLQDLEVRVNDSLITIKHDDAASDAKSRISKPKPYDSDGEPRASWVHEEMERLVLFGWLQDAGNIVERSGQYMADHEARFSEDIFDELREIGERLQRVAAAVQYRDEWRASR